VQHHCRYARTAYEDNVLSNPNPNPNPAVNYYNDTASFAEMLCTRNCLGLG